MDDATAPTEARRDPAGCRPAGPVGTLLAKPLALNTFRENVIVLARGCAAVRPERLAGLRKLEVRANGVSLLASLMISDDPELVGPFEVGLPQPAFRRLGILPGGSVEVAPARSPRTLGAIRAKIAGETLSETDYAAIARDLANHRWSDMEIAAFLGLRQLHDSGRNPGPQPGHGGRRPNARLVPRPRGRQALHRRHTRQPHLPDRGAHRRRPRAADPEDIVAGNHFARRDG